jgi:hypothetical protein
MRKKIATSRSKHVTLVVYDKSQHLLEIDEFLIIMVNAITGRDGSNSGQVFGLTPRQKLLVTKLLVLISSAQLRTVVAVICTTSSNSRDQQ